MRAAALTMLVLLAAPVAASAATVDAVSGTVTVLAFHAAPGEQNRLHVQLQEDAAVITDSGAPLDPGTGCEHASNGTVRCSWEGVVVLSVSLGDGDDAATADASDDSLLIDSAFHGGPGNDHIRGTDRDDALGGGGGRDVLEGGDGADTLFDGDRRGRRGIDGDVLDGGPSTDTVSYRGRRGALRVRLGSHGGNGERREGDSLRSVEDVIGGRGADILIGDHRGNRIEGWEGHDRLIGKGGPDRLNGGTGRDRLEGGSGDDTLESEERDAFGGFPRPETDSVRCGAGDDNAGSADRLGVLAADCERVGVHRLAPTVSRDRRRLVYRRFRCLRIGGGGSSRCAASIVLKDRRGRLVARGRRSIVTRPVRRIDAGNATFNVPLRITAHGRRLLRRGGAQILRTRIGWSQEIPERPKDRFANEFTFVLRP